MIMSKTCNGCGSDNKLKTVPYQLYEDMKDAKAKVEKNRLIERIVFIVIIISMIIGFCIYESQFETVESTVEEYQIEQNAESGNDNSISNGGEIVNGETEDNLQENNN